MAQELFTGPNLLLEKTLAKLAESDLPGVVFAVQVVARWRGRCGAPNVLVALRAAK